MKVARSSTPSNRKNSNSARLIPPAGSFTFSSVNTLTEPATSPTDSPDEAERGTTVMHRVAHFLTRRAFLDADRFLCGARNGLRALTATFLCFLAVPSNFGQSTFGTVLGTVHDPSGAAVTKAVSTITNSGTSARRSAVTDASGSYEFPNLEAGAYSLSVEAPGFQSATYTNIELTARQTVRVDGQLSVPTQVESVNVEAAAAVINTEVSNIAETKTSRELVDLPVAIGSRGN